MTDTHTFNQVRPGYDTADLARHFWTLADYHNKNGGHRNRKQLGPIARNELAKRSVAYQDTTATLIITTDHQDARQLKHLNIKSLPNHLDLTNRRTMTDGVPIKFEKSVWFQSLEVKNACRNDLC